MDQAEELWRIVGEQHDKLFGAFSDEQIEIFSVRSLWKQFGVRLSSAGHVNVRGWPPKYCATSSRYLPS
jgi:hypothetical protein